MPEKHYDYLNLSLIVSLLIDWFLVMFHSISIMSLAPKMSYSEH